MKEIIILETRYEDGRKGPKLLVDFRNNLVFAWSREDTWDKVPVAEEMTAIQAGNYLNIKDRFGLLDGLIAKGIPTQYTGPHPDGVVKCMCGAKTDSEGFCPRCHDGVCHICKKTLTETTLPSGEGLGPRKVLLCKDPTHNPLPIPHWRTKAIEGEELPPPKPVKWPSKFLELPVDQQKLVNIFFSNLMNVDRLDNLNWQDECAIHRLPKFVRSFMEVKNYYKKAGPLPER